MIGIVPLEQYRRERVYAPSDQPPDIDAKLSPIGFREENPLYDLSIVEFDDQGELFEDAAFAFVVEHIGEAAPEGYDGKLAIVLAHGWFHNARPGDANILFLKRLLAVMTLDETAVAKQENRKPRYVHGVFLAWRGAVISIPILAYLTFWNRKDAAHRVGERRATEVVLALRAAVYANPASTHGAKNRLILIGHSFGGALVYSATSQIIANDLLEQTKTGSSTRRIADVVLLFNPAFEAARVQHLFDTAQSLKHQLPSLSIFTSKTDRATGWAFPAARFFDSLFGGYRKKIFNPVKTTPVSQHGADVLAIGHYDGFLTHDLVTAADDPRCTVAGALVTPTAKAVSNVGTQNGEVDQTEVVSKIDLAQGQLVAAYAAAANILHFGETCLIARADLRQSQMAVFNVSMDKDIWDGHGLQDTPMFLSFLEHFIPFAGADEIDKPEPIAPAPGAALPLVERVTPGRKNRF